MTWDDIFAKLPKVRDDVDRIGEALKAEHWCAVVGREHLTVTGHRFCIGHEADDGHLDNRPELELGDDNHDWGAER